jgi:hypothetical protein
MGITSCQYSKKEVSRAGVTLIDSSLPDQMKAKMILDSWRACHVTPLNSFQTSLRRKLSNTDGTALVSQRLKRTPSILSKLQRNPKMMLARMQDIGGIRAVVKNMQKVRELESSYKKGTKVFSITSAGKDYINYPKTSGYRSVHQIFKCKNGFSVELQIRTQIQHAWATAVETMGTFLDLSLKSNEGPEKWLDFFALASSAFAILESTPRIPKYDHLTDQETFEELLKQEEALDVTNKLAGFRVAARHIKDDKKKGHYHLIILDLDKMTAGIHTYDSKDIQQANIDYSLVEDKVNKGENLQVVLVTSESIKALKQAYPSYFLDAELFTKQIVNVAKQLVKLKEPAKKL